MIRLWNTWFTFLNHKNNPFYIFLIQILGFRPENLSFYSLAFQHKSKHKQSNERLEFLGDAILDAVISEQLYVLFPEKNEGELSKLRAKIVNRQVLNSIGEALHLEKQLDYLSSGLPITETNILGNVLESLIGAIYLDKGYKHTQKYIENKLLKEHIDWKAIENVQLDFKTALLQYGQKNDLNFIFEVETESTTSANGHLFEVKLRLDNTVIALGNGSNKKKAEQEAAKIALEKMPF